MYSFTVKSEEIAESYSCIYFMGRNYDMKITKNIQEAPEEDDFYALFPLLETALNEIKELLTVIEKPFNPTEKTDPFDIRLTYSDSGDSRIIISDFIDVFCMVGLKAIGKVLHPTIHLKHNGTYPQLAFLYSMLKPAIFEYTMRIGMSGTKEELTNTGNIQKSSSSIINEIKKK